MEQRQIEKERIRLTREIAMLETQLQAAHKGKEDKLEENKQIRVEIAKLEEENVGLEKETQRLDEEIAKLDEEFKQAQLDAGRLRREIKISTEHADNENKEAVELRKSIAKLESQLDDLQRQVKREIDDRRNLESRLRKTNAQIDSMKDHWAATFVTRNLEKQDWYQRMEEPLPEYDEEGEQVEAVEAEKAAQKTIKEPGEVKEEKARDESEIDFGVD